MSTIEIGQRIKIKNNLIQTDRYYGLDSTGYMSNMKGNIYKVNSVDGERIRVKDPVSGHTFSFYITDIILLSGELPKLPEPVTFNTENLVL